MVWALIKLNWIDGALWNTTLFTYFVLIMHQFFSWKLTGTVSFNHLWLLFLPPQRIVLHPQQRCAFRKVQRKPEARKGVQEETGSPPGEMAEARLSQKPAPEPPLPPQMPPRNPRRLIKPLMFTIGVCIHLPMYVVCTFTCVWEHRLTFKE